MAKLRRGASISGAAKKDYTGPLLLIAVGVVILLAVVIWQLSLLPATTVSGPSSKIDIPFPEIGRITPADAKMAFDDGSALFVDVRDSGTFGSKHITGAINIPLDEFESRASELPKDHWIITVCT